MEKQIGSIEHTLSPELEAELRAKDAETKAAEWKRFEENLPYNAKAITEAFKSLYEIYDVGLVKWMANLFDPDICVCNQVYGKSECEHHPLCGTAGFHYTHSGRDAVGHMPNIEAMHSALNFTVTSGFTKDYREYFPKELIDKMASFVYNLQDPDGYFYHPHWGKNIAAGRRGRDYSWGITLLGKFGLKSKYPTLEDIAKDKSVDTGASYIPENLKSLDAFKEYLATLDFDTGSYGSGSVLVSQFPQIRAREEATGIPFIQTLGEFLDSKQRDNGIWHPVIDYTGINGLMKTGGVYSGMKRPIPNPERAVRAAIAAIVSDQEPCGIVDVWNPWVAFSIALANVRNYQSEERAEQLKREFFDLAPEALRKTKEKALKFRKPDGSFSYCQNHSTATMQGYPCAVPNTYEGDMDAAVLATTFMVNTITGVFGMSDYFVHMFGEYESSVFMNIITNRKPVRK